MATPDASLGIATAFPTATVRNALLFAMQMGAPTETTRQVRFIKKASGRRYFIGTEEQFLAPEGTLRVDRDGRPLNPQVRVEQNADTEVDVDVAIELTEATAEELPVGNFRPVKATVTLMGQEYAQIVGCREMAYNNDRYGFGYELEANGLFDLTVHTLIFFALDES